MNVSDDVKDTFDWIVSKTTQNLARHLGIEYLSVDKNCLSASMPVDDRTKQPFGILHGGASVALAETLASVGGCINVDIKKFNVVGMEINANHIRPVTSGKVIGTATPIHRGARTQVWEVKIHTETKKLVCVSRCTLAIVEK